MGQISLTAVPERPPPRVAGLFGPMHRFYRQTVPVGSVSLVDAFAQLNLEW